MGIHYFYEDVNFRIANEENISEWIATSIQTHGFELEEINYIFCSDECLLEINKQHLKKDYYTDIITFDNSEENTKIESDIFISIDRVKENATSLSIQTETELHRVMIHGVLHLVGFKDKTNDEKVMMREKENACLSLLKTNVPRET